MQHRIVSREESDSPTASQEREVLRIGSSFTVREVVVVVMAVGEFTGAEPAAGRIPLAAATASQSGHGKRDQPLDSANMVTEYMQSTLTGLTLQHARAIRATQLECHCVDLHLSHRTGFVICLHALTAARKSRTARHPSPTRPVPRRAETFTVAERVWLHHKLHNTVCGHRVSSLLTHP